MRSKLEPMKEGATLIRHHWDDIVRGLGTDPPDQRALLEALNCLFQSAKRREVASEI